jgi:hypothetical protein
MTRRRPLPRIAPSTTAAGAALVMLLVLGGCVADDRDAAPTTTGSRTVTATPTTSPGTDTDPRDAPRPTGPFGRSRLAFFDGCTDLLGYLQRESSQRVTAWGLGGAPYWRGGPMPMGDVMMAPDATMAAAAAEESSGAPTSGGGFSTTNTQEVGVDEGDTVETDGRSVFVASPDGVRIVDVASVQVVATLDLPQGGHELLLDDPSDRLLVVTRSWNMGEETVVSLYDVADPSTPTLVRRSHLEGSLSASRSVDGVARLVLTSSLATRLPFVYPDQFGLDEDRALEANQRVIAESSIDDWMPRAFDENGDGSFGEMWEPLDCRSVAAPTDFAGLGISWLATIDLRAGTSPVGAAGVVSQGGTVYSSASNLYLATTVWDWTNSTNTAPVDDAPPTTIHQFALDPTGAATYVASGEVEGTLLNQFSMSELDGDLRVATTVNDWNGSRPSESFVQVLRPDGGELTTIGKVGGLGLTEQIYAVRFLGTQAYVVTFRQTDPLYVIDLADPTAPRLAGELKIPGYSAYLHPVGDGLLLGVGQDATEGGRTIGTQLSLFDVRDPSNPQRISTLMIGGWSDAEWDHHAFLYWPEDGTIVIPSSPWWGGCSPEMACLADAFGRNGGGGLVVAELDGTELRGRGVIEQPVDTSGCWNPLQRSMVIGDQLVAVGFDRLQTADRTTLDPGDSVEWGDAEQYGCAWWYEG